jgi:hypothetical protein
MVDPVDGAAAGGPAATVEVRFQVAARQVVSALSVLVFRRWGSEATSRNAFVTIELAEIPDERSREEAEVAGGVRRRPSLEPTHVVYERPEGA